MDEKKLSREMTFGELKEIASILKSSDELVDFSLKFGNLEISLSRAVAIQRNTNFVTSSLEATENSSPGQPVATAVEASQGIESKSNKSSAQRGYVIKSPMIGTFYRSPEPGAPPFVQVGDYVKKGDVICLIEVMKLINSISAEQDGVISKFYVENADPVEFGQPLIALEPK